MQLFILMCFYWNSDQLPHDWLSRASVEYVSFREKWRLYKNRTHESAFSVVEACDILEAVELQKRCPKEQMEISLKVTVLLDAKWFTLSFALQLDTEDPFQMSVSSHSSRRSHDLNEQLNKLKENSC